MNAAIMVGVVAFEIFVREWLRDSGVRTEDGDTVVVIDRMIIAMDARGAQFELNHRFPGHAEWKEQGEDYGVSVRNGDIKAAEALAHKIERHLAAGGKLNMDHWQRVEGAYGSEAWQEEDAGGFYAFQEKRRDMEAEGIYS